MNKLLLPNRYKRIGWFILIPATILGLIMAIGGFDDISLQAKVFAISYTELFSKGHYFKIIQTDISNTIVGCLFIIGAILVGFSREKDEDEFIANLRLSSLLWAVLVNYVLLFLAFIFIYGTSFWAVMVYNMFTVLIIFITRFNFVLYKSKRRIRDEK